MRECGDAGSCPVNSLKVKRNRYHARRRPAIHQHVSPRITGKVMANTLAGLSVGRMRGKDIATSLDRTGAEQHLPMCSAGGAAEG